MTFFFFKKKIARTQKEAWKSQKLLMRAGALIYRPTTRIPSDQLCKSKQRLTCSLKCISALQGLGEVPLPHSPRLPPPSWPQGAHRPLRLGGVSVLLGVYGQKGRLHQPEGLGWGGSTQGETAWEKLVLLLPLLYPSCGEIPNVSWDKGCQLSASDLQVAQTQTDLGKR